MNLHSISAMPRVSICLAALGVAVLAACQTPREVPASAEVLPGSDRDAQGCIASAGYSWCERSGQCERPWELAAKAGFDNTAEGFDRYCAATATEAPAE